jgi:hypothetical protein
MKNCIPLLLILASQILFAQSDSSKTARTRKSYWVDAGLGWGGQGSAFDIGFSFEITPKRILSLRYSSVFTSSRYYDYSFMIRTADYPAGNDGHAYEVSYGSLRKGRAGIITFSGGLSFVQIEHGSGSGPPIGFDVLLFGSDRPVDYKLEKKNTVGLALRAQFIPSLRWGGLGISPYVQLNPAYTFASLTIQLAMGRLRPRDR